MVLSSLPLPSPLSLSLSFSLSPVQHPGLKILRSDSSSSISSRIGWVSPLSLMLSLSPNSLSSVSPGLSSSSIDFFSFLLCLSVAIFLSRYLHLSPPLLLFFSGLVRWFGLVAVPC